MRARGLCAATPLSRRAIVALVGSQVFFVSLSHVSSSSVVGLAPFSLALARSRVRSTFSFSLFLSFVSPSFFPFPHRSVNFHLGILPASDPRRLALRRFAIFIFSPLRNVSVSRIFGLYSYIPRLLNVLFPSPWFHSAENIATLTCLLAYVY